MSLDRFCRKPLVTVSADAPAREAARQMGEHHVGAVVVTAGGKPIGIVTDRDLVLRLVVPGRDADRTAVQEVMTPAPAAVRIEARLDEALVAMREASVRRMPVVRADGVLAGIVTLDDLIVLLAAELGAAASAVRTNRGP
jgi:CBS domain-containing protein